MKRDFLNYVKPIFALALLSMIAVSCDLEIDESDSIFVEDTDEGFGGVADVTASLNDLYNSVWGAFGTQENLYALTEVASDELLVPTRGTDWGDNGIWRQLHAHTWAPTHQFVLNTWNDFNQNVFRASQIIDQRSAPSAQQKAEAQFLRAWSMFWVLDFWGVTPFREVDEGADVDPRVFTSEEAYNFILNDLTEAIANLPDNGPSAENDRATKAAAHYLLAKLRLNANRYKGSESFDNADMQAVVDNIDAIEGAGFALQDGYFDIFTSDVDNETIWFANASVGSRIWNGLHYNQTTPDNGGGGWNGFSALAEMYDAFEGDPNSNAAGDSPDERRGFVPGPNDAGPDNLGIGYGFLIGQQYDEDGNKIQDRSGNDLIFTKDFAGLSGNTEERGIRMIKYHPVNGAFANHMVVFRYADALLMKAEAMLRMGNAGDALTLVNELRALRGASALGSLNEGELLEERRRELWSEHWRRNDLLRFGQFTKEWSFKNPDAVNADFRELYPIPINALLSNPNLVQNEGY